MTVDSRIRELEGSGPLRYGVHVYRSTLQVIPTGTTPTPVTFDTVIEDAVGIWANASTDARFKVPIGGTGLYLAEMMIRWDASSSVTNPVLSVQTFDVDNVQVQDQTLRTSANETGTVGIIKWCVGWLALSEGWEVAPGVHHQSGADREIETFNNAITPNVPMFRMFRVSR